MYCLETEEDHRRLRRICASLWRAGTSADAMTAAACMFYAAHYWWTEYIPENHICGPVLEALESSVVGRPDRVGATEASDRPKQLVQCLRRFYDRYPGSYYYSERTSRSQEDWHVVEAALRGIRQALDLESVGARGQGSDQIADRHLDAQCFARGITDLYLAAAIRYAQGRHDPDDAEVLGLYEDAERILAQAGDDMHREWCAFERADAYVDAARRYQAQAPGIFGRGSGAKARHCIDLGRTWCGECRRRASTGPHVDDEIVARSYRMDGDLLWMQGERAEALACYCAASYMALAFLEQDRDDYARHVYEETRRHIIERIGDIGLDEDGLDRAVRMCRLVYAFWNTSGHTADAGIEDVFLPLTDPNRVSDRTKLAFHRAILAEKLTRDLAPPTPRLSDLGDGDDITPYLAYARSILLAMPAHLKRIQADEGFAGFSMPADFAGAGGFVELTATRLTEPDGSAANE
ncbi:MAG: hypothetical protein FJX72_17185 [Armatimonadetes bacterium]|nr:hypothetical protein [Armatimonadota bacterium]